MNYDTNLVVFSSALLLPIVAALGSIIAYRQWRIAQNKLKLDLFEKRFAIYEAATSLLNSIITSGKVTEKDVSQFLIISRQAKWLLSDKVSDYLYKQLYEKVIDLQTLDCELEGLAAGEVRTMNVQHQGEIKKWLLTQYDVLDNYFAPFLNLRH